MKISVTGHRPDHLGGYGDAARERLGMFALDVVRRHAAPGRTFCSGMARGWDQAIAAACVAAAVPWIAVVPCFDFDRRWPPIARERFRALLAATPHVVYVAQHNYNGPDVLHARNAWLVEYARTSSGYMLALHDEQRTVGGTAGTVRRAQDARVLVHNEWAAWQEWIR